MKSFLALALFAITIYPSFSFGQDDNSDTILTHRQCGYELCVANLEKNDPGFTERRQAIEEDMALWIKNNSDLISSGSKTVFSIPVVVHVLYNTVLQNISHARIIEQINILNEDFRKLNADTTLIPFPFQHLAADIEFHFCLATRNPSGGWTNGVTRKQVTKTSYAFSEENLIKSSSQGGQDAWDRNKYLNIWVVNLSGGILGYTQPPGGLAATDGVVVCYKYFGETDAVPPFNKGRTLTHEVGHWFNLLHIWGDDGGACWGNDFVDDTPNSYDHYFGCPSFPQYDACTPNFPGVMFMNYMDYVDDDCMHLFTKGQKTRMLACLNTTRSAIISSDGCTVGIEEIPAIHTVNVFPNPTKSICNVELYLNSYKDVQLSIYDITGQQIMTNHYSHISDLNETVDMAGYEKGVYIVKINVGHENITRRLILQ
ncbi:MAG: M43 family zinc metalloprotease [Bacteroidales bacterium]|nr:M43 family zinc metalloprotease [Bacteroidales bacterium]